MKQHFILTKIILKDANSWLILVDPCINLSDQSLGYMTIIHAFQVRHRIYK